MGMAENAFLTLSPSHPLAFSPSPLASLASLASRGGKKTCLCLSRQLGRVASTQADVSLPLPLAGEARSCRRRRSGEGGADHRPLTTGR